MRKFLVIASILMVSAAAHAAPLVQMAANDTPPQAQPAPDSTAAPVAAPAAVAPAPAAAPALAAEPAKNPDAKTPDAKAADPKAADAKPVETKKPRQHVRARESDEHKARRIAAKYGVYW